MKMSARAVLLPIVLTVAAIVLVSGRASASCLDMSNETHALVNQIKNLTAAAQSGQYVMNYRNAAYLQYEKLHQENCSDPGHLAQAMAALALMDQELGSEDIATARSFPQAEVDCKAFALVLFQYRLANAWTELHFAYNHGNRDDVFREGVFLEKRLAEEAGVTLPSYHVPISAAAAFKKRYNAKRQHAIDITPGLCGMDREVNDTKPF